MVDLTSLSKMLSSMIFDVWFVIFQLAYCILIREGESARSRVKKERDVNSLGLSDSQPLKVIFFLKNSFMVCILSSCLPVSISPLY